MPHKPGSAVKFISPHGLFDSRPAFHHAATSTTPSRVIYTAGQVGVDENGVVPSDIADQIKLAFDNLEKCIIAAGASVQDIIKLTYYIVNYDPKQRHHFKPLMEFLAGHRPTMTLIGVSALAKPEFLFEVEAVALVPEQPLQTVDVVVVGAGLSGLQAARDIQRAGFSCVVLEARDRVGGKTLSLDSQAPGAALDVGAAWINDTNQSKVFALAKECGLAMIVQNTVGNVVQEDIDGSISTFLYGTVPKKLSENGGLENMIKIRSIIENTCQELDIFDPAATAQDLDKYTLEEFVKSKGGGRSAMEMVKVATRAMLGLEPRDVSALYFLDYCKSGGGLMQMRSDRKDGGQYLRFEKGTQSLSKGLASFLKPGTLILGCPVFSIEQGLETVRVASGIGQYLCKRVIVSIPTPLYKDISFQPPLLEDKLNLSRQTKLGCNNKMLLVYKEPWWRSKGLCGMMQSFTGPVSVTRDSSVDAQGLYSLTCFISGAPGLEFIQLSDSARLDFVKDQVKRVFSSLVDVPEPINAVYHVWSYDQWSQGCPCPAMPPGVLTKLGHALRSPHGKIHFVGTETAYEWKGYMDGALRSGERGATEVLSQLAPRAKI